MAYLTNFSYFSPGGLSVPGWVPVELVPHDRSNLFPRAASRLAVRTCPSDQSRARARLPPPATVPATEPAVPALPQSPPRAARAHAEGLAGR